MSHKSFALLLLSTAFLVGCGGEGENNKIEEEPSSVVEKQLSDKELKELTRKLDEALKSKEQATPIQKLLFVLEKKLIDEVVRYAQEEKDFTLQASGVPANSILLQWLSSRYHFKGENNEDVKIDFTNRSAVVNGEKYKGRIRGIEYESFWDTMSYTAYKYLIIELINTRKFRGVFTYLKDKTVKLGNSDSNIPFFDILEAKRLFEPASLAAGISPSTMARSSRQSTAGVDASQFQVNGISAGKVEMSLPISINLKGKIDGSKTTAGTSGTVAYKMGNTVLGVIHAYANKGEGFEVDSHQSETSVAVSQSIGNAFIEGQVGYIGTHEVHNTDMTGHRYQLSVGFDTEYVSPFVQVAYRDFGTQADASAYVGAELSIDRLKGDTYALDTNLSAKAGVDSKAEFTGSLEWSASLTLNSGISFKTDLTLGTVEGSTVGLTANISR